MTTTRAYLDYNATAPVPDAVRAAVVDALERTGNPSSVHQEGRVARAKVEAARERVGALVATSPEGIVFTSGGTEANALAIRSALATGLAGRLIVAATEHPSVLDAARHQGAPIDLIPVDGDGVVDLDALADLLESNGTPALVCIMHANNETGAVQPVSEAAALVREHGGLLHVDAVQTAGKRPVALDDLGADSLSLSAHKIGGPQGAGALAVRPGLPVEPLLRGGGQERGRRSGTENVPAIAGFGVAAEIALSSLFDMPRVAALRDRLEARAKADTPGVRIMSGGTDRLANTSCLAVPGSKAETLVIALDLAGVAVSSGSACSSGKVGESHVLAAMGVEKAIADGAVRASLGWATTEEDIERFAEAWRQVAARSARMHEAAA